MRSRGRVRPSLAVLVLLPLITGCASIITGKYQRVPITSTPSAMAVTLDGALVGKTPVTVEMRRKYTHEIAVGSGRQIRKIRIHQTVNGWWFANLVFGIFGVPGFVIDAGTGNMHHLTPSRVGVDFSKDDGKSGAANMMEAKQTITLDPDKRVLAIMDFDSRGVSAGDAAVITDLFRTEMVQGDVFEVVEKSRMEQILQEQAFQQTGCTSQECAVKLGKVLNVRYMAVGSFGMLMGEYILSFRVVDVESGRAIYSDSARGIKSQEDVTAAVATLVRRLGAAAD